MEDFLQMAEQISLFCRININTKRDLPIRSSEMGMLIYLCKTDGEKTPMEIAQFFNVSKAMATNMITAMCTKGYVEKCPSPYDRRSYLIVPTEKSQSLVESTYAEYCKTMLLLKEKMGSNFPTFLALLKQANNILLEEKNHG